MSGGGAGPLVPTFNGFVHNTMDGLVLFEACLSGKLHHVPRRPHDRERPEVPLVDVELVLLQRQPTMSQTPLAVADAGIAEEGRLGQVTWTFAVPPDQPLGRAVLKTEGSEPLRVRIVR